MKKYFLLATLLAFFSTPVFAASTLTIVVKASGANYLGAPIMSLNINGSAVAQYTVTADIKKTQWQSFTYTGVLPATLTSLGISFINDAAGKTGDRNLYIQSVTVNGFTLTPMQASFTNLSKKTFTAVGQINKFKTGNFNEGVIATWPASLIPAKLLIPPVNGLCGASNLTTVATAPVGGLCSSGTASAIAGAGPWSWSCNGNQTGSSATCTAARILPINGVCGPANATVATVAPQTNLCGTGTATAITGMGPWAWSCTGNSVGTTAFCSATKPVAALTPPVVIAPAPVVSATGPGVLFRTNWPASPQLGGWAFAQVMAPDRLRYDPNVMTNHKQASAHVVVNPGDNPINSSGERSEVLIPLSNTTTAAPQKMFQSTEGDTVYMATSYKFPAGWGGDNSTGWSIQLQLHGYDQLGTALNYTAGVPPAFAFGLGKITATGLPVYIVNGEAGVFTADQSSLATNQYRFNLAAGHDVVAANKWSDFIFRFTYSAQRTGSVTVWRRDEGETYFTKVADISGMPTLQKAYNAPIMPHYWKQGYYRNAQTRSDEFWMGNTAIATNFGDVEKAAFNTANGENPATVDTRVVNGSCGTADGARSSTEYSTGTMCRSGFASAVGRNTGKFSFWNCAGSNGGTSSFCKTTF